MNLRRARLTVDNAENLALQGLTFIGQDGPRLARFLSLTGLVPADLKAWSDNLQLRVGVLDFLLSDESLLLVFAAEAGVKPETIAPARNLLAGERFDG
jgi:hypothetical protein